MTTMPTAAKSAPHTPTAPATTTTTAPAAQTSAPVAKTAEEIVKEAKKAADLAKRSQKLMDLAAPRIEKAVKALAYVGNLGRYNPTALQIKALESAIKAAYDSCVGQLHGGKAVPTFQLPTPEEQEAAEAKAAQ